MQRQHVFPSPSLKCCLLMQLCGSQPRHAEDIDELKQELSVTAVLNVSQLSTLHLLLSSLWCDVRLSCSLRLPKAVCSFNRIRTLRTGRCSACRDRHVCA